MKPTISPTWAIISIKTQKSNHFYTLFMNNQTILFLIFVNKRFNKFIFYLFNLIFDILFINNGRHERNSHRDRDDRHDCRLAHHGDRH